MPRYAPSRTRGRNARVYLMAKDVKLYEKLRKAYENEAIREWAIDIFSEVFRSGRQMSIEILSGRIRIDSDVTGRIFYQS